MKASVMKSMKELDKFLTDPKTGVNPEAAHAIAQLFSFILEGKQMDTQVENRWHQIGRLSPNNRLILHNKDPKKDALELVLMALEYQGLVTWTPE